MCQIDFVISFIWFQCETASVHTASELVAPGPNKGAGDQLLESQQLSIPSHPVQSLPFSPVQSCPLLCALTAAAYTGGAHLPALPLFLSMGCTSGLKAEWFTYKQKQPKQQNPTGSANINCCFPNPQGSQSSFFWLNPCNIFIILPIGRGRVGNVRWADVSKVIEFIISRTRRRIRGCGCWGRASVGTKSGSGSIH